MATGMDWVRVNSTFPSHPKALRVGPIGELIHLRAICYCAQHLTDGVVPAEAIETFLRGLGSLRLTQGVRNRGRIKLGQDVLEIDWIAVLVEAGLWERCAEGYRLHDYLQYNPTREEYEQIMHTKRENGRRGGLASAQARAIAPAQGSAEPPAQAKSKHVTVRNETKREALSFSGPIETERPAEPSPEPASNGSALTPEQVTSDVRRLVDHVLRPRP